MLLLERLHGWCSHQGTIERLFMDQQESNLIGGVTTGSYTMIMPAPINMGRSGKSWTTS